MRKQSTRKALILSAFCVFVLGLVLPANSFKFGRGGDKDEKEKRRRLSEQNRHRVEYDMDASTGTVREVVSKEHQAEAEAAKTCDGQLASSMVKATEERNHAFEARDKAIGDLNESKAKLESLKEELLSTTDTLTAKIGTLEEQLEVEHKQAEIRIAASSKQADDRISEIQKKADSRVTESNLAMKELQQAKDTEISDLKAQLNELEDSIRKETDQIVAAVKQETDSKVLELSSALEAERLAAAESLAKTTEELTKELDALKKSSMEDLEKLKNEAKAQETAAAATMTLAMEKLKKEHASAITSLQSKLSATEKENEKKSSSVKSMQESLKEAKEDLKHWKGLYEQRSYCNVTHIGEDVSVVALAASKEATAKLTVVASQVVVAANRLQKKALIAAKPHISTSKQLYEEHVEKHVEKIRPHYNQYAAPLLKTAVSSGVEYHNKYGLPLLEKLQILAKKLVRNLHLQFDATIDKIVELYAKDCPMVVKEGKRFARKHDVTVMRTALESLNASCKQPRQSVTTFLTVVAIVYLYLLRHLILRFIRWVLFLPFRILWFFFPLRFLFSSRKSQKTSMKDAASKVQTAGSSSNGIRVKKNGAVRVSQ